CDAGPWGAVWKVLTTPGMAAQVAAVIRAWEGEEPRELWTRLRAQGWGELETAEEVGADLVGQAWTMHGNSAGDSGWIQRARFPSNYCGPGAKRPLKTSIKLDALASRVEAVARWLVCGQYAYRTGAPESGFCPSKTLPQAVTATCHGAGPITLQPVLEGLGRLAPRFPVLCRVYHGSAMDIEPPGDCEGTYVYADPSYRGCTGYQSNIYAEDLKPRLLEWSEAGAVVVISEARPLADLMGDGWHVVEITGERIGQKRTFSAQKTEWLTMNREPLWRPAEQVGLFHD
ncbi:MAG: hypothetical protein WC985_08535, partial [Thermoplasmata archaeon]